jgi:hypothetical protein
MQAGHAPGRQLQSTALRKLPRSIAPAKLAAKVRVEVARLTKRRAYLHSVVEQMEALAESQRKRKARLLALNPVLAEESTPMQQTKDTKSNKLVRLLQLSALAIMSGPR